MRFEDLSPLTVEGGKKHAVLQECNLSYHMGHMGEQYTVALCAGSMGAWPQWEVCVSVHLCLASFSGGTGAHSFTNLGLNFPVEMRKFSIMISKGPRILTPCCLAPWFLEQQRQYHLGAHQKCHLRPQPRLSASLSVF